MPEPREVLPGSARNAVAGASLIGKADGRPRITVTVVLKRRTEIRDDQLLQHALMRPHERGPVNHSAFAEQYGASDAAIAAITSFAAAHELTVEDVDKKRRVVKLTGLVADMEKAFGTQLDDYAIGRHTFRGRRGPLLLPPSILPHVIAVLGLDNRPVAKPRVRPRTAAPGFYPQQLAALYKFPQGDGTGETIALIELGGQLRSGRPCNLFRRLRFKSGARRPNCERHPWLPRPLRPGSQQRRRGDARYRGGRCYGAGRRDRRLFCREH